MRGKSVPRLANGFGVGERVCFVAPRLADFEGQEGRVARGRADCPDRVWVALDCLPGIVMAAAPEEIAASAPVPRRRRDGISGSRA